MDQRERDKQLIKALYKYMLNNYKKSAKNKAVANQVVADVLDPNHEAEVDPDKIPSSKSGVMSKANNTRKQNRRIAEREKGQKGVNTSGGFSGLQEKGSSQAGNEMTSRAPKAGNEYLKRMHHERGKQMHREKLQELKAMPKPKLTKGENQASNLEKAKGEEKQRRKKLGSKASWAREKAYMQHGTMKDGTKYMSPGRPELHHEYGINKPYRSKDPGTSVVGHHIKEKTHPVIPVKEQMKDKVAHLKAAPKPNLPKTEQNKVVSLNGVKRLKNYMQGKKKG